LESFDALGFVCYGAAQSAAATRKSTALAKFFASAVFVGGLADPGFVAQKSVGQAMRLPYNSHGFAKVSDLGCS
jgi:hypothetical protein